MAHLEAVNVAVTTTRLTYAERPTGIGKQPVDHPVLLREPGDKQDGLGSGLVGDVIGDHRHHGGTDQAVYAVSRENLDSWTDELGLRPPPGYFGENLTTVGLDVDGALLGEQWRVGPDVVLQVTCPRIPCGTFRGWVARPGWLKSFTAAERPGAYLRIVAGGRISAGDEIRVVRRPDHGVSVAFTFRAILRDARLLPELLAAGDDLSPELRARVESGQTFRLDS